MSKPKRKSEHRAGKYSGYDVLPDGSIKIAPMYFDEWAAISDRQRSLARMTDELLSYHQREGAAIEKAIRQWWERLYDDLGLNPLTAWQMHPRAQTISEVPRMKAEAPPEKKTEAPDPQSEAETATPA